jgi:pilus assembly protein CpaC
MSSIIMSSTMTALRTPATAIGATLVVLALGSNPAIAQVEIERGPAPHLKVQSADRSSSRKVDLSIGKSLVITLPSDAKEVFVADPKVANAVVRSSRQI